MQLPAAHSRFVQRIRRRYADELTMLPPGLPGRDGILALVRHLQEAGDRTLVSALRVCRQLVLERLAVLDVEGGAPLAGDDGPPLRAARHRAALRAG